MKKQPIVLLTLSLAGGLLLGLPAPQPARTEGAQDKVAPEKAAPPKQPAAAQVGDKPAQSRGAADLRAMPRILQGSRATVCIAADPAFDRRIDLRLLGPALFNLSAADVADLALTLADSERVLLRHHRCGITAAEMTQLAIKLAVRRGDKETLARLGAAAEKIGDKDLQTRIHVAEKLTGASRVVDASLHVSVEETTPAAFAKLHESRKAILRAELLNDDEQLAALEKDLAGSTDLPGAHHEALKQQIAKARASMPKKQSTTEALLTKLTGPSRDMWENTPFDPNTWRLPSSGGSNNTTDLGPTDSWTETRYQIGFVNRTTHPVQVHCLAYNPGNGKWVGTWNWQWTINPGQRSSLLYQGAQLVGTAFQFYAQATDGSGLAWGSQAQPLFINSVGPPYTMSESVGTSGPYQVFWWNLDP